VDWHGFCSYFGGEEDQFMPIIDRETLEKKVQKNPNLVLVEVLEPEKYEEFHLPGAMNVPLSTNFEETIQQAVPDKSQEIVVYCSDDDCDASPTAARKMEELGYEHVYDYSGGKKDWKDAGLPVKSSR
jgi:rhodanese-related sulfurtransferase